MITGLAGRFHRLNEYRSNPDLLRLYQDMIDFIFNNKGIVLRFYHYPYDYNASILGYLTNDSVNVIFLKDDKPVSNYPGLLDGILKSQYGFIEIYKLDHEEYRIDWEMLLRQFQVLGEKPEKFILRLKLATLSSEIEKRLNHRKSISEPVNLQQEIKHNHLIYSRELSEQLGDVTYRASILLRRDYHLIETNVQKLLDTIYQILMEKNPVVVIIKINSTSIWMTRQYDNRVGFTVFSNITSNRYKIKSYSEIEKIIEDIISKHGSGVKKVRIFVYELRQG